MKSKEKGLQEPSDEGSVEIAISDDGTPDFMRSSIELVQKWVDEMPDGIDKEDLMERILEKREFFVNAEDN